MARLSYAAPGVYVEEIPSARQPIAGVGTNTAGFIGIVPDKIYIPVPNPGYDPMLTRELMTLSRLSAAAPMANKDAEIQRQKDLDAARNAIQERIDAATAQEKELSAKAQGLQETLKTAQTAVTDATSAVPPGAAQNDPTQRALLKAQNRVVEAQKAVDANTAAIQGSKDARTRLEQELASPPAPPAAAPAPAAGQANADQAKAPAEVELDFEAVAGYDGDLLKPSVLRPYYLVPFDVDVEEGDTKLCTNFSEYTSRFGNFSAFVKDPASGQFVPIHPGHHMLTHAVNGFFANGGTRCFVARVSGVDKLKTALTNFESIEDVAILAAPGLPPRDTIWKQLTDYCEDDNHQNVFAVLDCPGIVADDQGVLDINKMKYPGDALPQFSKHGAYYFPWIEVYDPSRGLQESDPALEVLPKYRGRTYTVTSGHLAGVYARTDEERGVFKAPANTNVRGALEVKYYVSKAKQELLNPQGVNCIRLINGGVMVWGARTVGGDMNGDSKYVPVRRFLGFLEESIDRGTQWIVFEPNDENLWSKIILNTSAFLTTVWRSGALFGLTAQEAFYVKCDAELNPPEIRDLGQVVIEVGVSIVRPAEFVIFRISQMAGQPNP